MPKARSVKPKKAEWAEPDEPPKKGAAAYANMDDQEFLETYAPTWDSWIEIPPPECRWLVHGWLPAQGITILSGHEKRAGKSLLAFQLAICVAEGLKVHSMQCHQQGKVLYVLGEMPHGEVHDRVWAASRGLGLEKPSRNVLFNYLQGTKLDSARHQNALKRVIRLEKPALIILDTFFYLHDVDENSPKELSPIVDVVQQFQRMGCAVLLLVHLNRTRGEDKDCSLSGQIRGSNALPGVMDYHIALRKYKNDDKPPRCCFESRSIVQEAGDMMWNFDNRIRQVPQHDGTMIEESYPYITNFELWTDDYKEKQALEELADYIDELEDGVGYGSDELAEIWGVKGTEVRKIKDRLRKAKLGYVKDRKFRRKS